MGALDERPFQQKKLLPGGSLPVRGRWLCRDQVTVEAWLLIVLSDRSERLRGIESCLA